MLPAAFDRKWEKTPTIMTMVTKCFITAEFDSKLIFAYGSTPRRYGDMQL